MRIFRPAVVGVLILLALYGAASVWTATLAMKGPPPATPYSRITNDLRNAALDLAAAADPSRPDARAVALYRSATWLQDSLIGAEQLEATVRGRYPRPRLDSLKNALADLWLDAHGLVTDMLVEPEPGALTPPADPARLTALQDGVNRLLSGLPAPDDEQWLQRLRDLTPARG